MPVERSYGYTFPDPDSDIYVGWLDFKPQRIDRFKPGETPLQFHAAFCTGCCEAHEELDLGGYAMGWEL